jgi:tetratricopeptide (TPR) repeat protein
MLEAVVFTSPISSKFVGRSAELAYLSDRFAEASNGKGSMTIIKGEAGIGKSRLVNEFRHAISERSVQVAVGRCIEYLQAPYAPWYAIFSSLFNCERELIRAKLDADPDRYDDAKRQAFRDAAEAFTDVSGTAPLVLIIEDSHWADTGTLELLDYVASLAADHRIMLITTLREPASALPVAVARAVARLERQGAHAMRIVALSRADVVEMMSRGSGDTPLLPAEVDQIVEFADGNPLFVEQLTRDTIEQRLGGSPGTPIPSTLRDLVTDRLRLLSTGEREVLLLASAIGRRFDPRLLVATGSLSEPETIAVLKRACELQLLAVKPEDPVVYGFYHSLVREAVYREIPPSRARAIHRLVALAWERLGANDRTFADLAYQWSAAEDFAKASEYNAAAGDAALRLFAYADALRFYERARDFDKTGGVRSAVLNERIAAAQYTIGSLEEALHSLRRAFEYYSGANLDEHAMRVLERIILIQSRNYDTEAGVKVAERALDGLAHDLESRVAFGLLVTTAGLQLSLGREVHAERLLRRAESAAATDADILDSAFYDVRARLRGCHGEYTDAIADFAESIRIARATDGGDAVVRVLTNAADLYATLGRTEEALQLWTEAHDLSRVNHLGWRVPFTAFGLARVLLNMGELARATGYVESALRYDSAARAVRVRAAEVGIPLGMLVGRVDIVTRCDDVEIVERVFSSHDAARLVSLAAAYIPLLLERGAVAEAKSLLKRAAGMLASGDEPPMLYVLVAQHAALGGLAEARSALVNAAGRSPEHVANALLLLFDAVVGRRRRRIAAKGRFVPRRCSGAAACYCGKRCRWNLPETTRERFRFIRAWGRFVKLRASRRVLRRRCRLKGS